MMIFLLKNTVSVPQASCTIARTVNMPVPEKICVAVVPVAVLAEPLAGSPKFQLTDDMALFDVTPNDEPLFLQLSRQLIAALQGSGAL